MKIQQGYIVYQIPAEEIVKLRKADCFGNLCDSCNQTIEDTYYIPVLNWGMCKKCFDEWKETAIFYKEDTDFEELIGDSVLTVRTVYAHMLPSRRKDVMVVLDKSIPKNLISI